MFSHNEGHFSARIGWLRAAVLGANDGIVSTASLIVGVAAAQAGRSGVLTAGIAGLIAGAMSMASGEYVSVSSQADAEDADLERERHELETNLAYEQEELTRIYMDRGLDEGLARKVALQLMDHDALGAHARDELGLIEIHRARPVQAAMASAASFAVGAALPLALVLWVSMRWLLPVVSIGSLMFLALLGALASRSGGAKMWVGVLRVTFWGAFAMALTALVGRLLGAHV